MLKRTIILIVMIIGTILLWGSTIKLKIAEFDPKHNVPDFSKQGLQREYIKSDSEYYLVQFNGRIMPHHKAELQSLGAEIFDYIPDNAFIVKLTSSQFEKVKGKSYVRFMQIWQPAYRISPELVNKEQVPLKNEQPGIITLHVSAFWGEDAEELKGMLKAIPDVNVIKGERIVKIEVPARMARDIAVQIANWPSVYWVERYYPVELHNAWSRWIMDTFDTLNMDNGSGAWYGQFTLSSAADSARMPLYANGLYGQGQIIGDDDTGLDWDNVYFRDPTESVEYDKDGDDVCENPNYNHRKVVAYNVIADTFDLNSSGHGTHTSGSATADSLGSDLLNSGILPAGNGMAPLAKLAFTDIGTTGDGLVLPTDIGDMYRWAYSAGAKITTSSWGYSAGGPGNYTQDAQNVDWVGWNNKDICMFRSSGNSNTSGDSINSPATAKNIVAVGATESGFGTGTSWNTYGVTTRNELLDVAEFSSHGPTAEEQFKPELCGSGGWYVWSVDSDGNLSSNNSGLTYMGGTSMSTPTTAGFGAIVRQYFEEGWYPSGSKTPGDALNPSGALVKATLINSTRNSPGAYSADAVGSSGSKNAPSYGQGWGRVTMSDVIYFDGDTRDLWVMDETTGFSSAGQTHTYSITTGPSTDEYIKVVLVWTDYPAGVSPSTVVVNDLDLEVDAGGSTYLGNVFGTNTRSITGGSADSKNVTEVVWLDAIPNSSITIRVKSSNIPNGPQPYALVATGDFIPITGHRPEIPSINKLYDYARVPDTRPTLEFSSTDEEGDSIVYRVLYDTDQSFASPDSFITGKYASGTTVSAQFPTDLSDNTTYWWKVKAKDPDGSDYWSGYSSARSFTVFAGIGLDNCSWYQTTGEQFANNILSSTIIEGDSIILSPTGSVNTDTLLFEDFEDQNAPGFALVDGDGSGSTWAITATGRADLGGNEPPGAGNYYMYYSDDDAGSGNSTAEEYLYSPSVYTGNADSLTVQYGWGFRNYIGEEMTAHYRTYSSGTWSGWTQAAAYNSTGTGTGNIDLSDQLPCDSVQVYWVYDDMGQWGWAAAVDNIIFIQKTFNSNESGSFTTVPAYYNDLNNTYGRANWGYVNWQESSVSDSILVQIQYCEGGVWNLVPDGQIANNSIGISTSSPTGNIDISGLNISTYDSLRAVFNMIRTGTKSGPEPAVHAIEIGSPHSSMTKVNMANISAVYLDGVVNLKWRTSFESDNAKWIIQRSSADDEQYADIAFLAPKMEGEYIYTDKNIQAMKNYDYRIKAVATDGSSQYFGPIRVTTGIMPLVFGMRAPTPSVFNNETLVRYQIPHETEVVILVYDLSGRVVNTLIDNKQQAGFYSVRWNGRDDSGNILPSGTYFIRMNAADFNRTEKTVLIR